MIAGAVLSSLAQTEVKLLSIFLLPQILSCFRSTSPTVRSFWQTVSIELSSIFTCEHTVPLEIGKRDAHKQPLNRKK